MDIQRKIFNLKPRYLNIHADLIKKFAQFKGGSEDSKYEKSKFFGSTYEFYMYAYFIGVEHNRKRSIGDSDASGFWEIENWKPRELVRGLVASAIAESDFDMVTVEHTDEEGVKKEVKKILETIESFANGGFVLIKEQLEEDPTLEDSDLCFVNILSL